MTRSEASLQRACMAYARSRGCLVLRLRPPPAGVPDVVVVLPGGATWWVEFKTETGRLRPAQATRLEELRGLTHVVTLIRDTLAFSLILDTRLRALVTK